MQVEKQKECISLCWKISLINEQLLDPIYAIFYKFKTSISEDGINAHYSISSDIVMSVLEILNDGLNKVL